MLFGQPPISGQAWQVRGDSLGKPCLYGSETCLQVVQVLSGGHGARTYQDERFSYVVLRRGSRPGPETIPDLTVARQRQVDAPDAVQRAIEAGEDSPYPASPPATLLPIFLIAPTCSAPLIFSSVPPPLLRPVVPCQRELALSGDATSNNIFAYDIKEPTPG